MRNVNRKMIAGSMVLVLCLAMVVAFAGCKDKVAVAEPCAADCTKACCADKDAKTCGPDCTKPCCADKDAKTCGPDCTKPCCADKDAKTCGPDCTKPCCADKDAAKCPPDCTKPCCAGEEAVETTTNTVEQTTCPVMGGKINKDVSVEYEGKKVYFCCGGCDDKFLADPDKYVAKLPQFSK